MSALEDGLNRNPETNRDPISGALGAHPIGTGVGAAAGGIAAAAAVGSVAGPLGTVIGATIGAVAGGLAGKGVAAMVDPAKEDAYWRDNYSARPYVASGSTYDDYGPAYRYGVDAYGRYEGRTFDDAEADLRRDWDAEPDLRREPNSAKGSSSLTWEHAKHAARDSWQRVSDAIERAVPGDSDHDGK